MKIKYNLDKELLWFGKDSQWSAMGIDLKVLRDFLNNNSIEYDDKLMITEGVSISDEDFQKLRDYWFDNKYQIFKGLMFDRDMLKAKKDIARKICMSYENNEPLMVIFESGYESYPSDEDEEYATVSDDGLIHIIRVGGTTGGKGKFPIHLASKYSDGGGILSLHGIKEVQIIKGL